MSRPYCTRSIDADRKEAGNEADGLPDSHNLRASATMLECLILGDSLAQGAAAALARTAHATCDVVATQGIGSAAILRSTPKRAYETAVISAGSNDPNNPNLTDNLVAIRRTLSTSRVVWIAPYNRSVANLVADLARYFGDSLVDIAETPAVRDGLHPQSYRRLADLLREGGFAGR